ncbi:lipid A biosynthesis lauroyl acyltransferase [Sinorhizobium meliloti WSM1022]|uniref:lipid A biosynthesis lauroyl acyltransferase n=1 Tax=Rhizobium meliloti TaxID=382 RepID=UPI0004869705|nr:lipid A biosynthesis lauroyl acyltransferase [Sinorhizobium meliloti]ASQ05768.1 lipid A biosynthesis lauroyl acyltransferase [Sinorhizobium meliloti]MCO6423325.1 lipid A biosynthesis lauroyl acyltransferase [Sinorhizobium meliloti]MDW9411763.1 lipid A biosynthesis lauroyl acyltransferase [Sinorhizobium meliloti]MDW9414990.1 lipid A biosynthesis lauroyl acyltransferase [Sinorhizobium meliloti]MDW9444684.1 lipid A biosynthesis lauroyl acyltransferase [Sinorhizobium meliloti]
MLITRLVLAADRSRQWSIAQFVLLLLTILKLFPADMAINFMDRVARWIGPKTGRHKLTLINLRNAFPEKSDAEIEAIALESWGNMGRLAAEYVFLDQLFDFDPARAEAGRVEVSGIPLFLELRDNPRPFIVFTAHSGNFEMLPVAGSAFGLDVTVLFRPPNNPYLADRVFEFRKERMGNLVPSHAGSSFALARQLERGGGVGVLVDQKFRKGLKTKFFGQDVQTNPLLAKLVRQFNCEVYPARCIRLPGNRFRLELEPAVEIPRRADGSVDVTATAQMLNDKVESWVREYPGQWLWYHDRWHIKRSL